GRRCRPRGGPRVPLRGGRRGGRAGSWVLAVDPGGQGDVGRDERGLDVLRRLRQALEEQGDLIVGGGAEEVRSDLERSRGHPRGGGPGRDARADAGGGQVALDGALHPPVALAERGHPDLIVERRFGRRRGQREALRGFGHEAVGPRGGPGERSGADLEDLTVQLADPVRRPGQPLLELGEREIERVFLAGQETALRVLGRRADAGGNGARGARRLGLVEEEGEQRVAVRVAQPLGGRELEHHPLVAVGEVLRALGRRRRAAERRGAVGALVDQVARFVVLVEVLERRHAERHPGLRVDVVVVGDRRAVVAEAGVALPAAVGDRRQAVDVRGELAEVRAQGGEGRGVVAAEKAIDQLFVVGARRARDRGDGFLHRVVRLLVRLAEARPGVGVHRRARLLRGVDQLAADLLLAVDGGRGRRADQDLDAPRAGEIAAAFGRSRVADGGGDGDRVGRRLELRLDRVGAALRDRRRLVGARVADQAHARGRRLLDRGDLGFRGRVERRGRAGEKDLALGRGADPLDLEVARPRRRRRRRQRGGRRWWGRRRRGRLRRPAAPCAPARGRGAACPPRSRAGTRRRRTRRRARP